MPRSVAPPSQDIMAVQNINTLTQLKNTAEENFVATFMSNLPFIGENIRGKKPQVLSKGKSKGRLVSTLKELRRELLDITKDTPPNKVVSDEISKAVKHSNKELKSDIIRHIVSLLPYTYSSQLPVDENSGDEEEDHISQPSTPVRSPVAETPAGAVGGAADPPVGGVVPGQGVRARALGNSAGTTVPELADGRVEENDDGANAHVGDTTPVLPPAAPAPAPASPVHTPASANDWNSTVTQVEMQLAVARLRADTVVEMTALKHEVTRLRDEVCQLKLQNMKLRKDREDRDPIMTAKEAAADAAAEAAIAELLSLKPRPPPPTKPSGPASGSSLGSAAVLPLEHVAQAASTKGQGGPSTLGLLTPPTSPEPALGLTTGVGAPEPVTKPGALSTHQASARSKTSPTGGPVKSHGTKAAAVGGSTADPAPKGVTAANHGQMAAPKRAAIFIGNVDPRRTASEIHEVIKNAGIHEKLIEVLETNIRSSSKKAFKALVPEDDLQRALDVLSGIPGLLVEKWKPTKPRPQNQGERVRGNPIRSANTFHGPHPYRRGPPPNQRSGWGPNFPPFWPPPMWNQQRPNFFY